MRFFRWHVWRYPVGLAVGAGLAALGMLKLGLALDISLYAAFIAVAIIYQLSSRIPFGIASAYFIAIIIVSILVPDTNGTKSNLRVHLAIGAFSCLVAGVILLICKRFGQPRKPHTQPSLETDDAAVPDPTHAQGLSDIAVPKALPAPRPAAQRPWPAAQSAKSALSPQAHTPYKPHLAPHPLLHPVKPKPVVQARHPIQPASNSRIINDVMRPVPHKPTQPSAPPVRPTRQGRRRKLVQL